MVAGAGVGMFVTDTVSRDPVSVLVSEKFISLPSICCALGDGPWFAKLVFYPLAGVPVMYTTINDKCNLYDQICCC